MTDRDRERIALDEEAENLKLHVKMCAFRHEAILSEIRETRGDLDKRIGELEAVADRRLCRIEKAAWAILAAIGTLGGATVTQITPIMRALAGQ